MLAESFIHNKSVIGNLLVSCNMVNDSIDIAILFRVMLIESVNELIDVLVSIVFIFFGFALSIADLGFFVALNSSSSLFIIANWSQASWKIGNWISFDENSC